MQVLRDVDQGDSAPVLAAVGPHAVRRAVYRLENEFGAPVELSPDQLPHRPAHRPASSADALQGMQGVRILQKSDGTLWRCSKASTGSSA